MNACDASAVRLCVWDSPAAVPEEPWRDCLMDSDTNEPTLSPEWLQTWWEVFGSLQGRRGCLIGFYRQDRLIGLAPLLRRTAWFGGFLPLRRFEVLASGERSWEAICSDYVQILARRGEEPAVATALLSWLANDCRDSWDELCIPLANGDSKMSSLLVETADRFGLHGELQTVTRAPYIPLPATWEEYLRQLSGDARYLVQRSLRDFDRWANGSSRIHVADTPARLEEGQQILYRLHRQRWQGQGGVFRAARFLAFHEKLMPRLLRAGALELLWLTVRGDPVAALYNIVWSNKTSMYQCGRKLDVPARIRPGGVLMYNAIRRSIEARRREFDFLGGEVRYKKQLAPTSRPIVEVRLARPGSRNWLRGRLLACKAALRPFYHWLRGRRSAVTLSSDSKDAD
jgi:hypothetical protein